VDDLISRQAAIDALIERDPNCGIDSAEVIKELPSAQPEIIQCKECKYYKSDYIENVNGVPLIVAHEICLRWGDGVKTLENGYCFLAER